MAQCCWHGYGISNKYKKWHTNIIFCQNKIFASIIKLSKLEKMFVNVASAGTLRWRPFMIIGQLIEGKIITCFKSPKTVDVWSTLVQIMVK